MNPSSIPRMGSFSPFSSIDLGRRSRPPLAAARCRRATSPSLLLVVRLWGELCLALEHVLRAPPAPLRPRLAGTALRRRRRRRARRARTHAKRHTRRGCARTAVKARPCLDPAWVGRLPSGACLSVSGPALLGALSVFKHVYFCSDFAKSVKIRL
jgi:hypothetical protein